MTRYVNMGSGNYNEKIEGDYVEGLSITTTQSADGTIKKTIIKGNTKIVEVTKPNGEFSRTETTISPKGNSIDMNFKNRVNNVVSNVQGSQIVQGNGNQVIQQSGSNIAIGHMNGGHIGDNVTVAGSVNQVVQGNGNKVSQSAFTNMNVGGDLTIGDIKQTMSHTQEVTRDEALNLIDNILNGNFFGVSKEELTKAEERRKKASKPHVEETYEELPDLWEEEEEPQDTDGYTKREEELDELMYELANIIDKKASGATSSRMLHAADFVLNLIKYQPLLKQYYLDTPNTFYEELSNLVQGEDGQRLLNIINNL